MPESSTRSTVRKAAMVAAGAAATVALATGAAGTASASTPSSADVQAVAASAPAHSALGAALNRVSTEDSAVSPLGKYQRW
ncbi:hypothetical protein [Actinacidiphila bryophytorum]|nr:hypothetical protein [Actinacidiphila bryophytorum]MBM9439786.1 hypothetical protein [Actinacidiphila bryophytorum]MBN6546642.1 hypothetical protein [Actinacidiphila bryophytorum]